MNRNEKETRARIVHSYINQANKCKKTTYAHFIVEGVPKSTSFDILKKYEDNSSIYYKSLCGRPQVIRKIIEVY